jgi:hypothetical protein
MSESAKAIFRLFASPAFAEADSGICTGGNRENGGVVSPSVAFVSSCEMFGLTQAT